MCTFTPHHWHISSPHRIEALSLASSSSCFINYWRVTFNEIGKKKVCVVVLRVTQLCSWTAEHEDNVERLEITESNNCTRKHTIDEATHLHHYFSFLPPVMSLIFLHFFPSPTISNYELMFVLNYFAISNCFSYFLPSRGESGTFDDDLFKVSLSREKRIE